MEREVIALFAFKAVDLAAFDQFYVTAFKLDVAGLECCQCDSFSVARLRVERREIFIVFQWYPPDHASSADDYASSAHYHRSEGIKKRTRIIETLNSSFHASNRASLK